MAHKYLHYKPGGDFETVKSAVKSILIDSAFTNTVHVEYFSWNDILASWDHMEDDISKIDLCLGHDASKYSINPENCFINQVSFRKTTSNGRLVKIPDVDSPDGGTTGWFTLIDTAISGEPDWEFLTKEQAQQILGAV